MKMLASELDPHLICCTALAYLIPVPLKPLSSITMKKTSFVHIQFFDHMRVRSHIFVPCLDFLVVFLCLYVGSAVPVLCAA